MLVTVVLASALALSCLGLILGARWGARRWPTAADAEDSSPGLLRALVWGGGVGWLGGVCLAIEDVWAHGYLERGLGRIALELGRRDVVSTLLVPLAAAATAWGITRAHPRLRSRGAVAIWFTPPAALAAAGIRHLWPACIAAAREIAGRGPGPTVALIAAVPLAAGVVAAGAGATWRRRQGRRPSLLPGGRALAAGAVLGLALLGALELAHRRARSMTPPGPNLVLVVVDTLRADALGCYGGRAPASPNLDRLAASGIRFAGALAQSPWTMPSVASILTSLYPSQHRADSVRSRLRRRADTLTEVLRDAGYHTLGVVSHDFVDRRHGFAQGFARFDDTHILGDGGVTSDRVSRTALSMLGERPPEPFFLLAHYFDPHFRYIRHPGLRPRRDPAPRAGPRGRGRDPAPAGPGRRDHSRPRRVLPGGVSCRSRLHRPLDRPLDRGRPPGGRRAAHDLLRHRRSRRGLRGAAADRPRPRRLPGAGPRALAHRRRPR